jgi:ABC-2 type transport system ATP-binding protein
MKEMRRDAALDVSNLGKEYDEIVALDDVSFSIPRAELVALVGHNGAGKSTLMGITAGLIEPTNGTVLVAGYPAGSLEARGALAYAGDTPILYDDLSVWEHLEYVAGLHGVDDWESPSRALLESFDLEGRSDDLPSRFSRGMRQKAALAVVLVRSADVLVVDEPFVGLDVRAQDALAEVLLARARAGTAVIVATHQPSFLTHVDRCVMLRDGRVSHNGPPSDAVLDALRREE